MSTCKFFSILLVIAAALMAVNASKYGNHARALSSGLPYPLVPHRINITIEGIPVEKEGPLNEIYSQLLTEYPDFKLPNVTNSAAKELSGRDLGPSTLFCVPIPGWDWQRAWGHDAYDMMQQMKTWVWQANLPARSCTELMRLRGSQVIACNDAPYGNYPTYSYMSDLVFIIMDRCWYWNAGRGDFEAGGQQFDLGGFNVILRLG